MDMPNNTVKNLTLVVAVVALASAFAMAQAAESQAPVHSLTGTVRCEAQVNHFYTCQRNQTQQSCALACVQQGSRFVLVVGGTPYLLQGDSRDLRTYAGGKATITGVAMGDHIEVQTASSPNHSMPGQGMPSSMGSNADTK
jgi:hypothetical protein